MKTLSVIDYLNGTLAAKAGLTLHSHRLISAITWVEVMSGARGDGKLEQRFLASFSQVQIDSAVSGLELNAGDWDYPAQ